MRPVLMGDLVIVGCFFMAAMFFALVIKDMLDE